MELSELTAYAEEKFHIREQHKWDDFPGFSVLADPNTGKWVALLMRQWDSESGTEIQRCDIKCGVQTLTETPRPYLGAPYRMKGPKWVGVRFDENTDAGTVYHLFDRAVYSGEQRGYTIVLGDKPLAGEGAHRDTALPACREQLAEDGNVPEKILEMLRLYDYRGNSLAAKAGNFYRQGKFMADYEDNLPWRGEFMRYFPTYHDLNIRQLRGYFTWRAHVRHGEFMPVPTSLAYIYIYELLNGIGASAPEDALQKLCEFKVGFLDSGVGSPGIYRNLNRWMLEYAVINGLPAETAREYADPELLKKDAALAVLSAPDGFSDEEVFRALCAFAVKNPEESPVVQKFAERGRRLFAATWRCVSERSSEDGKGIFTECFGEMQAFPWRPLSNAVYWVDRVHPDADYVLDECRSYRCRGGLWEERRYDGLYFDLDRFNALLHETDRVLRRHLKTGHYLHAKPDEAWATEYAEAAVESVRRAELEAARPKVELDLTSLERIRRDASATRDSLLIGSETEDDDSTAELPCESEQPPEPEEETAPECAAFSSLDETHRHILHALAVGESADGYIREGHLMPSVVADTINEALFDEFGDTVIECDGDSLTIIEDYREDILRMFGGKSA